MTVIISGDNGVSDVDGSASTPAIRGTDANTGIFFPAADTIAFSEGGAEAMRINSSGAVLIGGTTQAGSDRGLNIETTSSGSSTTSLALQNQATGNGSGVQISFRGQRNTGAQADYTYIQSVADNTTNGSGSIRFWTADSGTLGERMRITPGGEVFIAGTTDQGVYNLQCNGTGVWGAGAYVNGSDERIKDDIEPIASGLDIVEKLNPVTYRYKESWSKDQSVQTGFIAQELLAALDGQVYVNGVVQQGGSEGYYSVAYQNVIPILTKAIQELKAINDAQAQRIETLEAKVAALEGAE